MDLNLGELIQMFKDEEDAWKYFERRRWPHGPVCPHCGVVGHSWFLEPQKDNRKTRTGKVSYRRLWKCASCRQPFSVIVGTVMEDSRIPLSKWAIAWNLMCAGKNGVSSHELHRNLGITYKSAWFLSQRIRKAMETETHHWLMTGDVELDETYIGGKKAGAQGGKGKAPVLTLVQRGGQARSRALKSVTAKNIREVVVENVAYDAHLNTDSFPAYMPALRGWEHDSVDHVKGEWRRGKTHTNTVEGFFSQMKRSLDGTYHHVSEQHLHRYLAEFDFRYGTRKDTDTSRTVMAIQKSAGKRLMYRDTKREQNG